MVPLNVRNRHKSFRRTCSRSSQPHFQEQLRSRTGTSERYLSRRQTRKRNDLQELSGRCLLDRYRILICCTRHVRGTFGHFRHRGKVRSRHPDAPRAFLGSLGMRFSVYPSHVFMDNHALSFGHDGGCLRKKAQFPSVPRKTHRTVCI